MSSSTRIRFDALRRGSLRHDLVARILAAIFRGELRPGDRLVAQNLAGEFGVSVTPIREALLELSSIGMVELLPNRGGAVRQFGPEQIREIYQLRRVLEVEATRCACRRLDRDELARLADETAALTGGSGPGWSRRAMAADRRLHDMVAAGCGSVRLSDEISRYNVLVQSIREEVGNESHAQERALAEHYDIITALLTGHAKEAAERMARHIDNTAEIIVDAMFHTREPTAIAG
jgi:DNA-binding GntR family transcriptional regulator